MTALDSILSATEQRRNGGAKIVSQQHDVNKINWARGLSDPGEMISCGYLPEARRLSGEDDVTYQRRLEAMDMPKILGPVRMQQLIAAAIKRAGYDTSNGKVNAAFHGDDGVWAGLGTIVDREMTGAEARRFAGMDFFVSKRPLCYLGTDGAYHKTGDSFGLFRDDTGAYLGAVGTGYKPIQAEEGFDAMDSVLGEFGAHYNSAGVLYDGRAVWMSAEFPQQKFAVNGDEHYLYATLVNYHILGKSGKAFAHNKRAVCANTIRQAMGESERYMSIRHTGDIKQKIADMRTALGVSIHGAETYKEAVSEFVRVPVNPVAFADAVLDSVPEVSQVTREQVQTGAEALAAALKVTQANIDLQAATKKYERMIKGRESIRDDILSRYHSGRCEPYGTVYGAYQSVLECAEYAKLGKESRDESLRLSRRFESNLDGERDSLKQAAFSHAAALVSA